MSSDNTFSLACGTAPLRIKVFCFFFSKKKAFLICQETPDAPGRCNTRDERGRHHRGHGPPPCLLFLDADEFLDTRETPDIRAYLARFAQEEIGISLELVDNEVPTPATADELNVAQRLVRWRRHGSGWWKVFVNAPLDATHVAVASGNNHVILDGVPRGARPPPRRRPAPTGERWRWRFTG